MNIVYKKEHYEFLKIPKLIRKSSKGLGLFLRKVDNYHQ